MCRTVTFKTSIQDNGVKRLSAACQQVALEDFSDISAAKVVVRSSFADPQLWPTIEQHKCNNTALTSSGLYADMAATVAQYIWKTNRGFDAEPVGTNVQNLEVHKTYIAKVPQPSEGQWVEMEATLETPPHSSQDIVDATLHCLFREIKPDGTKVNELAHCKVSFEFWPAWVFGWRNSTSIIQSNIDSLRSRATMANERVKLVGRSEAYIMFQTFVDYGPKYQNMVSVAFDTQALEATSQLGLQPDPVNDYTGSFYLDASCHVSGFLCNAVEEDAANFAYISHGWDNLRLSPNFRPEVGGDIQNYCQMQTLPHDKTVLAGDVYVLQEGEIVGVWEGVKFKKIPRRVLNHFLPPQK